MKRDRVCIRTVSGAVYGAIMMVWLLGAATPFSIVASTPDWAWNLGPKDGHPRFLVFCPRLLNRENERPECIRRASEQASKYADVRIRAKKYYRKRALFTEYMNRATAEFDEDLAVELLQDLAVEREYRDEEGTYILARLTSADMKDLAFDAYAVGDGFEWAKGGFEIPGYRTAVGVAKRRRLFSDSIESADRDALVQLAMQISSEVESGLLDAGKGMQGMFGYEAVEAQISGFYVLARGRSDDGRYYYSLAVCQR
jgi:hypothetical protein